MYKLFVYAYITKIILTNGIDGKEENQDPRIVVPTVFSYFFVYADTTQKYNNKDNEPQTKRKRTSRQPQ